MEGVFLKLELTALTKALESDSSSVIQRHIKDALLFRHYRYELYSGSKRG